MAQVKSHKIVLPGEQVSDLFENNQNEESNNSEVICLGPGLLQTGDQIQAINSGVLRHIPKTNKYWVQGNKRKYTPATGEPVIGVITAKHAEGYRVDIGSAHQATLPLLAFEGATKRNKPNLSIGALIYAKVSIANKDMDPEIECYNSDTGKSEGFGELKNGFTIRASLGFCHRLLTSDTPILSIIGQYLPFEVAIGLNGHIWVNAGEESHKKTVMIGNAIENAEHLNHNECQAMVKELMNRA
ncbi:exosome non-catalytic core subunit rrp40 [Mycoemilia scoparia]|uniref:Ribosomal RNA-processing protein 40 n=1 Tax=Mycoemilia scoparia TaxID=417184 RepID=A0A9W7ZYX7_9FUNG|nr:exosome non-catalytic core subunit rrp40 [Mycoemilia scoparia]